MRRVIIESPYTGREAGDQQGVEQNLQYLRECLRDALRRFEAPFASHGLYTQPGVLDDNKTDERRQGIEAGFAWRSVADATIVYTDLGITKGMQYGIDDAKQHGRPIEYRKLAEIGSWRPVADTGTILWGA